MLIRTVFANPFTFVVIRKNFTNAVTHLSTSSVQDFESLFNWKFAISVKAIED